MTPAARELVLAHGTPDQLYALPRCRRPNMLKQLCREILFRPMTGLERWRRIETGDLPHTPDCRGGGVRFVVHAIDTWCPPDPEEWQLVLDGAGSIGQAENLTIERLAVIPRRHVGFCDCGAKVQKLSALVSFRWASMIFSREYAL